MSPQSFSCLNDGEITYRSMYSLASSCSTNGSTQPWNFGYIKTFVPEHDLLKTEYIIVKDRSLLSDVGSSLGYVSSFIPLFIIFKFLIEKNKLRQKKEIELISK